MHAAKEDAGDEPKPDMRGFTEVEHGTLGYEPHESPWMMTLPLVVLGVGAVFAGCGFAPTFLTGEYWQGAIAYQRRAARGVREDRRLGQLAPTIVMLIGLAGRLAGPICANTSIPGALRRDLPRRSTRSCCSKWYFDELYDFLFVRPAFALGRFFWVRGDQGTIDRFGPDGISRLVAGRQPRRGARPVRLCLHLCAGDAARPCRCRDLGDDAVSARPLLAGEHM